MTAPQSDATQLIFHSLQKEVWIITAAHGASRGGLLATFVMPASIEPTIPLVLIALATNHHTHHLVRQNRRFAAHLVRPEQVPLAWSFALGSGRDRDKLAGLQLETSSCGVPLLCEALAGVVCEVIHEQTLGERTYFWGLVKHSFAAPEFAAKTARAAHTTDFFSQGTPEQHRAVGEDLRRDCQEQLPLLQNWLAAVAKKT